ncbi:MAG TPA: hypothetical protein VFH48_38175 [Chloroflexota bacterium]|nr:hypothetical protein [Chloroflexota bacterium]
MRVGRQRSGSLTLAVRMEGAGDGAKQRVAASMAMNASGSRSISTW